MAAWNANPPQRITQTSQRDISFLSHIAQFLSTLKMPQKLVLLLIFPLLGMFYFSISAVLENYDVHLSQIELSLQKVERVRHPW